MIRICTLILWLIPSLCLAYNPSAGEILSRMEHELRWSDPVVLQVFRETPDGLLQREYRVRIPADSPADAAADEDFPYPFSYLTLPGSKVPGVLKSLSDAGTSVKLGRIEGSVCYLLEGQSERLWLRKSDFVPLRIETFSETGEWTAYTYLDFISISEEAVYPSRTEVQRGGSLVIIERLIPSRAATDKP